MNSRGGQRFVFALVMLVIAVGAAATFLITGGLLEPAQIVGDWQPGLDMAAMATSLVGTDRAIAMGAAAVVGFLSLALLIRMIRPARAESSSNLHMLVVDDQGFVVVDSRGIATVARGAATSAYGVVDATVSVRGSGTTPVRLKADIGVYPGADIKRAGNEARASIREAVDELIGLEIRDVTVAVHVLDSDELVSRLR